VKEFEGGQSYTMFQAGQAIQGGMVTLGANEGIRPHWIAYVTVDDVDATVQQVTKLKGTVVQAPEEIPGVGHIAVIADPEGAQISIVRPDPEAPLEQPRPEVGAFCWNELMVDEPAAARRFYTELFGWTCREISMGEGGIYLVCSSAGQDVAGMMQRPPDSAPPSWLGYVSVADVDASAALAGKLGGTTVVEPTDIPDIGRFAVCLDPAGACFALFQEPPAP
jgi:predicted enzyme related to lactoylglutathione lyase